MPKSLYLSITWVIEVKKKMFENTFVVGGRQYKKRCFFPHFLGALLKQLNKNNKQ